MTRISPSKDDEGSSRCGVVIVNYNSGDHLRKAVQCALADPGTGSVVVVDNGSSDASVESIESILDAESRVKFLENRRNVGYGAAVNQGARVAGGEFLLALNPDCTFSAGAIARVAQVLSAHPEAAMAGAMVLNPDGSEQKGTRRNIPTPTTAAGQILRFGSKGVLGSTGFDTRDEMPPSEPVPVEAVSGAFVLIRRAAWEALGGFDEGYFLHCEDLDLFMRARRAGWSVLLVPDAIVFHQKGACSTGNPVRVEWHKHRGMWRFHRKFYARGESLMKNGMVYSGIALHFLWAAMSRSKAFRRNDE